MKIERDYKNASKHKWWKITLQPEYTYKSFIEMELKCLKFAAYGFSSKRDFSKKIHKDYLSESFTCYGTSKDDVVNKEKELIEAYYNYLLKEIKNNKEWFKNRKQDFKHRDALLKSFFEIKEIKMSVRKKKLLKINK